jgi:hypothetical protein
MNPVLAREEHYAHRIRTASWRAFEIISPILDYRAKKTAISISIRAKPQKLMKFESKP